MSHGRINTPNISDNILVNTKCHFDAFQRNVRAYNCPANHRLYIQTSYNSFKARTKFLEWQYTTICGHGWLNDELVAFSATTTSDCIESCVMYNAHKSGSDRTCVCGGFIPEWWNQTRAMNESGGMAYDCFLKSNASGIARNDEQYGVVAVCLDGWCDDVLG